MRLDNTQRKIATQLLVEKSDRNMEQAVRNADLGYWDLVANRLYYSIFHAVNAMLVIDGIMTSSHKGTSSQFGRYYVLTGIFSREDGILYSRLQSMREKADYQNTFELSEEDGKNIIASTSEFRERLKKVILKKIEEL